MGTKIVKNGASGPKFLTQNQIQPNMLQIILFTFYLHVSSKENEFVIDFNHHAVGRNSWILF